MKVVCETTYKKLKIGDTFRIKRCPYMGTYVKKGKYFEDICSKKLAYRPLYGNTIVEKIELWLLYQYGYLWYWSHFPLF